jgi:hypothetical protein
VTRDRVAADLVVSGVKVVARLPLLYDTPVIRNNNWKTLSPSDKKSGYNKLFDFSKSRPGA